LDSVEVYKVFDAFKKPDEEQNNAEQNTAEPIENLEVKPGEESKNEEVKVQSFETKETDMLSMLEALGGEERTLIAEKSQLLTMEETLRQRIKDEIEVKRHRIENLKYEIPELRQRCEALAKALDIPVHK
jgi:predicted RNase H-like nuclease (RuvC/YqgF family)